MEDLRFNNIADYLPRSAELHGDKSAIFFRDRRVSFIELEAMSAAYGCELRRRGVESGYRVLILLRPGPEFIAAVFAVFRIGAVPVLIDPGMGRENFLNCVRQTAPEAMIGIARAQWLGIVFRRAFGSIKLRFAVGRGCPPWVPSLSSLSVDLADCPVFGTDPDDVAAIVFTTGSTGPPKGVVYTHRIFVTQTELIREVYGAGPEEMDMPAFPLFALFSAALGMPCVIPDMDPSRPANVDPEIIIQTVNRHQVSFSFASPALWRRVCEHCSARGIRLHSLKKVLMAGAPVSAELHQLVKSVIADDGDSTVPYGATEALPIANMTGSELIRDTAERTFHGEGYCVGRPLPGIDIRIMAATDASLESWNPEQALPAGERGEIIVSGAVVTPEYCDLPEHTAMAKMLDADGRLWHRMGDVGYFDDNGRLWFCGRKAHRVITPEGILYSVCCEAVFNRHEHVFRSALVGVGESGRQTPVIIIEAEPGYYPKTRAVKDKFIAELRSIGADYPFTAGIRNYLFHRSFPVDIRHNAKIFRERLAVWAAARLCGSAKP